MGLVDRIINIIYKRNSRYLISLSLNEISILTTVSLLDILQLESLFFPIQFLHHCKPQLNSSTIHFLVIGSPSTLFRIQEKALKDLFSFWNIQERNNQPIDIGRAKRVFQCIISRSSEIHGYRKKSCQIDIFSFDHLSIVNMIYKNHYYKQYYTPDREISIAC